MIDFILGGVADILGIAVGMINLLSPISVVLINHCCLAMLQRALENSVKNNPDVLVDDFVQAQPAILPEPIPQPVAHGDDQKRNDAGVLLLVDIGDFFKLIFKQVKNRLLSLVQISLILPRQLVPFAQDQQTDFLILVQMIGIGTDQFLKGLFGIETLRLTFFYPLSQHPQEDVRMLDQYQSKNVFLRFKVVIDSGFADFGFLSHVL